MGSYMQAMHTTQLESAQVELVKLGAALVKYANDSSTRGKTNAKRIRWKILRIKATLNK